MSEITILYDKGLGMTFWAKKGDNRYSRDIKSLLDYLGIKYNYEENE